MPIVMKSNEYFFPLHDVVVLTIYIVYMMIRAIAQHTEQ